MSSLNYGRVLVAPPLLVAQSIATAYFPRFVDLSSDSNVDRHQPLWDAMRMCIFLLLPLLSRATARWDAARPLRNPSAEPALASA